MSKSYIPLPVLLGDTFGSTLAVMLFPNSIQKARNWHAKHLACGALTAYRRAGHVFDEDRFDAFLEALSGVDVSCRETQSVLVALPWPPIQ